MAKRRKCEDCGGDFAAFADPRDPPIDLDECLCRDCAVAATEEAIDRLECELEELRGDLETLVDM